MTLRRLWTSSSIKVSEDLIYDLTDFEDNDVTKEGKRYLELANIKDASILFKPSMD